MGRPKIGYKERETKLEGGHKKSDGKFIKGKNYFMKIDLKKSIRKTNAVSTTTIFPKF